MTEKTSNLHHETFIDTIDTLITPFSDEDFKDFQPQILITFGGMVVSKRIKSFLRKYKPQEHWHIDTLRAVSYTHLDVYKRQDLYGLKIQN